MRKVIGKILVASSIVSVLLVGNAFAERMDFSDNARKEVKNMMKDKFGHHDFSSQSHNRNDDKSLPLLSDLRDNDYSKYRDLDYDHCTTNWNEGFDNTTPGNAPVPEPATMVLLGTGLVGLVGFARKKARIK